MANINVLTRHKQRWVFIAAALTLSGVGYAAWYLQQPASNTNSTNKPKPVPNMTGVVSSTFDSKVGKAAMADLQHTASEADRKLKQFNERLAKLEGENKAYKEKIEQQEGDIQVLQAQLEGVKENVTGFTAGSDANGNAVPGALPVGNGSMPSPNISANQPAVPPPTAFYTPGAVSPAHQTHYQMTPQSRQGIASMTIDYGESEKKTDPELPYIPSGSFAQAVVIEGADANASVTGSSSPVPMQFRLTGLVNMPNDEVYDLRGCMVTSAAYGDISSERALARTDRLSCKKDGKTIDMKFEGHVSFMGKNGIRAEPVIRNGKLVGYAFAAGAIEGISSNAANIGATTVGIGATSTTSLGDVARTGLGGGAAQSGKMLSEYLIKRAEQFHAVIPVGAGVEVTVVFQKGFQLEFIDLKKKKTQARDPVKTATDEGVSVSQKTLQQLNLKQLNLGDTVMPEAMAEQQ